MAFGLLSRMKDTHSSSFDMPSFTVVCGAMPRTNGYPAAFAASTAFLLDECEYPTTTGYMSGGRAYPFFMSKRWQWESISVIIQV